MTGEYIIRGLPASLERDGWWLSCDSADEAPTDSPTEQRNWADLSRKGSSGLLALVVLVALADWLFWGYAPGISVALFSWALFGAAALLSTPNMRHIKPALLFLLLTSLPVIEHYQALSMGFQLLGLITAVAWLQLSSKDHLAALPAAAMQLLRALPLSALRAFLKALLPSPIDTGAKDTQKSKKSTPTKAAKPEERRSFSFGLNAGSVLRALVMFNLILAVQSVMDLSILIGGAALPEGMSLATYAHRGAYPLLATAMLAGGFALAARPYLGSHASLKPLMMLWLGQNALLGLSSVLRLDLYVASFGLTYLRLYAMIWIGLVVVGLMLTAWQILKVRSNRWLLLRCAGLGLGTLYICAFVNFASVIATQNLSMKSTQMLDLYYLCTLGPNASGGIHTALQANPDLKIPSGYHSCWEIAAEQDNWREWGFRSWRVSSYAGLNFDGTSADKAKSDENPIGR